MFYMRYKRSFSCVRMQTLHPELTICHPVLVKSTESFTISNYGIPCMRNYAASHIRQIFGKARHLVIKIYTHSLKCAATHNVWGKLILGQYKMYQWIPD